MRAEVVDLVEREAARRAAAADADVGAAGVVNRHDVRRIGDRPGRERDRVEDGEEGGVQADCRRERADGHSRETRLVRRRSEQ